MKLLGYLNKSIEFSFYALFFFVPLVLAPNTSELFEFNKMWLTFGLTALIGTLWFSKMIILKKVVFKRTLFDLPIVLFLAAMIISSIFSLDTHVSFWGYYSRWNGGLLSLLTYIFLFYAFVSNFFTSKTDEEAKREWYEFLWDAPTGFQVVKRSLIISIISGLFVALWTIPSHFGYDPTCLFFRGELNVACWTDDFQPMIRAFGPLGQPDWLAGYISILLPLTLALAINALRKTKQLLNPALFFYGISFILFYITLLFSASRSGMIGGILASALVVILYLITNIKNLSILKNIYVPIFILIIVILSFFIGIRVPVIEKISFHEVKQMFAKPATSGQMNNPAAATASAQAQPATPSVEGGTSSLKIRKIVWEGAIDGWKDNKIFGTGVETFAFAYYKYKPVEHNRVSEWNFLYNKAHNEYLNYLTTTGIVGLATYLFFQLFFIVFAIVNIFGLRLKSIKFLIPEHKPDLKDPVLIAFLAAFLGISLINFFGFSVVIMNIYLFLIPAFALVYISMIKPQEDYKQSNEPVSYIQWSGVAGVFVILLIIIWFLINSWSADTNYALGLNYDRANQYQMAYPYLQKAVSQRQEPVFEDEFSTNQAVLALAYAQQQGSSSATVAQQLAKSSFDINDRLIKDYPQNLLYWKSRIRIGYLLASADKNYLPIALNAAKNAEKLAPTDASILYNLGVITGQSGNYDEGIKILTKTIQYKPDYREAYLARAQFYHDKSTVTKGKIIYIIDSATHQKALDELNFVIINFPPANKDTIDTLNDWSAER